MKKPHSVTMQDIRTAALEALIQSHDGQIGPQILLDSARCGSSPFHGDFEWDDGDAAELYRLVQAGHIIRRWKGVIVKIEPSTKLIKVSATRSVQSPQSGRGNGPSYKRVSDIMADPVLRADMLQTVLRELLSYRKRYSGLSELADIWAAADEAVDRYLIEKKKRDSDDQQPSA